jgi:RNA polymerase sigma-70 factor (ECF subfamily)
VTVEPGPHREPPEAWGDVASFETAVERHHRELRVHCYRMTGSILDAEDLVQETFLRAWRGRAQFERRASLRAWLYQIATNACLDSLKHASRRTVPVGAPNDDPLEHNTRIQPFPDAWLPGRAGEDDPAIMVATNETIELAFIAALTQLPPRQRAALIARDVLGFTVTETATLLDVTEASTNSLLQRARATLRRRTPSDRLAWSRPRLPEVDQRLLRRYMDAHERGDADAIIEMLRADVRITMPPYAPCIGHAAAVAFFRELLGPDGPGEWRLVPTSANGRPATANYLRRQGDSAFRALSIDVLTVVDGGLVEVNCFLDDAVFGPFGLPPQP